MERRRVGLGIWQIYEQLLRSSKSFDNEMGFVVDFEFVCWACFVKFG